MSNLMRMLPVHKNDMPPLDEFVVTTKDYSKKLPQVVWNQYYKTHPWPEYNCDYRGKIVHIAKGEPKPTDVEIILAEQEVRDGWTIVWD